MAAINLLLLLLTSLFIAGHTRAECTVAASDMPSIQPVLLSYGTERDFEAFLRPDAKGVTEVATDQQLVVACPNATFVLMDQVDSQTAKCVQDTQFSVDGTVFTLNALACSADPAPTVRLSDRSCGYRNRHSVVEVGFQLSGEFYLLYEVCFSTWRRAPVYTHHTVPAEVAGAHAVQEVTTWIDGDVYEGIDVTSAYESQNETLLTLLGLDEFPSSLQNDSSVYLLRQQLAPAEDLMLPAQQGASFVSANSAPQWRQLSEGNWKTLEENVRSLASGRLVDLQVFTGTRGVLALRNSAGVQTQVFLDVDGGKFLPVPKLFWKVVYDPESGQGAAFVGVNNPFVALADLGDDYLICEDICDRIDWIRWDQNNRDLGLAYCCRYSEFKARVFDAPSVPATDFPAPSAACDLPPHSFGVALVAVTAAFLV